MSAITLPKRVSRSRAGHLHADAPTSPPSHTDAAPTDVDLLARCAQHDERAANMLWARYARLILYVAARHGLPDAQDQEDVLQRTWLVLIERRYRLREPDKLRQWLYGVAVNQSFHVRARRGIVSPIAEHSIDDFEQQRIRSDQLRRAVEHLPEDQQRVFVLIIEDGRTVREIAHEIGVSESRVYQLRGAAFAAVKQAMQSDR